MSETRYLRANREAAGVSVAAVAEAIGISVSAVSYIETGKNTPRVSTLYAYAKAVGMLELVAALEPIVAEPAPVRTAVA